MMISSSKGSRGLVLIGLLSLNQCGPVGEETGEEDAVASIQEEIYIPGTETPNDLLNNNSGLGVMALYNGTALLCSAVYLGNRWVLTARHCMEGVSPTNVFATALKDPGPTRPVNPPAGSWSWVQSARYYTADPNVDLVLLRLLSAISATYGSPAAGRIATSAAMAGKTLLCAGYGYAKPDGTGRGRARKVWLPVDGFRSTHELRLRQDATGRFMYWGDSGGPCFDTFSAPGGGGAVLAGILKMFYTSSGVNYDVDQSVASNAPYSSWITTTAGF